MNKMMNPEMEVVRFGAEDIMTASLCYEANPTRHIMLNANGTFTGDVVEAFGVNNATAVATEIFGYAEDGYVDFDFDSWEEYFDDMQDGGADQWALYQRMLAYEPGTQFIDVAAVGQKKNYTIGVFGENTWSFCDGAHSAN